MARRTIIELSKQPFDAIAIASAFGQGIEEAGAIVTFLGQVSREDEDAPVTELYLDHMPAATLASIERIADAAEARWPLIKACIIHRVGTVLRGQPIVFVACAARHRRDAFEAADYLMDFLKSDVLLWKKEIRGDRADWIEPRPQDYDDKKRWEN
ncbi:MAG: molybdenum cofactor biosynthesis protein MoaE [Alphaproteobacteria bacterium]|nr:molybdenum cofactor biosynthesis protein MoaE [Alphaproteobacteria bacterium]